MKLTYEQIKPYIEGGLVSEQAHPDNADVRIFNYTHVTQFEKKWDEVTMACRGLIMNVATGEYLANPFPKFFNYGEYKGEIPAETPIVYEKMDGSLGILYWLNGKPWIATRGSFTSDQAIWATNWLRKNVSEDELPKNFTLLFEIIYPENRIVVSYDWSGLFTLACRDIETGRDIPRFICPRGCRRPKFYGASYGADLALLKAKTEENAEGFVVFYPTSGLRLKIKFDEYMRLHRLVTGVSEKSIWELLKDGKDLNELLDRVPDEFYRWVTDIVNELKSKHKKIADEAISIYMEVRELPDRKSQAIRAMEKNKELASIVFSLLDGNRKGREIIWKMIRPKVATFKRDIDS